MRNRALKFALGFIILGLMITTLIIYVQRGAINSYHKRIPYVRLNDEVKGQVAQANLWLPALKVADPKLNFDSDVAGPLSRTQSLLQTMYDGGEGELGTFEKPDDEETLALLKELIYSVQNLGETAKARWNGKPEIITEATDSTAAIYDTKSLDLTTLQLEAQVRNFQLLSERLTTRIDRQLGDDMASLNGLSWLSILALIVAFSAIIFLIYRAQHRAEKVERERLAMEGLQDRTTTSLSNFMEAISAGNYNAEMDEELNQGTISKTLSTMRDKLRANGEEDRKRNWTTSGLAQIGELLRTSYSTTQDLFDNILKFVVKYTKSSQGGLFLLNEETENKKFLELVACYAFERKKYLNKNIEIGEGLVGQSFLEAESIHLVEVPEDYISIGSSLGAARPNALLLVPLKVNGKIFGILELATFGRYEQHEIELVEKLAESIASTISTVRINESTRILLEKTQQQTEEMRAQEEEMRQNMEELEATQEEMRRKEKHIQTMLDSEKKRNEISNKNRQAIIELSKKTDIQEGNWISALEKMTISISKQLSLSRSSVWTYYPVEKKLVCDKLFDNATKKYEAEGDLFAKDFPSYFEAITSEVPILAKDAHTHVATRELTESYLVQRGIQSLVAVPFFNEGKIAGIICCESHEQRDWTDEDIEFLKACSDLVTLTYNNHKINSMMDKLSDDQETMQTVIDNIPRAVFWKGKDLRFQGCNKIFAQVAGLKSSQDLIGHTDYDMPWREHGDAYRADDLAVMNSRKARLDLEEKNVNNEGKVSWVMTSKVPVMNKHGEIVAVLGMFEDITDRKIKEADLAAKLRELEELKKRFEK